MEASGSRARPTDKRGPAPTSATAETFLRYLDAIEATTPTMRDAGKGRRPGTGFGISCAERLHEWYWKTNLHNLLPLPLPAYGPPTPNGILDTPRQGPLIQPIVPIAAEAFRLPASIHQPVSPGGRCAPHGQPLATRTSGELADGDKKNGSAWSKIRRAPPPGESSCSKHAVLSTRCVPKLPPSVPHLGVSPHDFNQRNPRGIWPTCRLKQLPAARPCAAKPDPFPPRLAE